jgi:hypothetical protein
LDFQDVQDELRALPKVTDRVVRLLVLISVEIEMDCNHPTRMHVLAGQLTDNAWSLAAAIAGEEASHGDVERGTGAP